MKKYIFSIIAIFCLTLILGYMKYKMFGNETIYIEDYMPGGEIVLYNSNGETTYSESGDIKDFPKKALRKTISYSIGLLIINIILAVITRVIFIKWLKIFEPKKDYLLTIAIAVIPVILIAIQLYNQMGYTC